MKYIIIFKSGEGFEFETRTDRDEFIEEIQGLNPNIEYATTDVEE